MTSTPPRRRHEAFALEDDLELIADTMRRFLRENVDGRRPPADLVRISPTRNVSRLGRSSSFSCSPRACAHCWMRCRLAFTATPVLRHGPLLASLRSFA